MQNAVISIVNNFGYVGILVLIFFENILPPIPSVAILSFCGFMTTLPNSELSAVGVIISSTIGSIFGSLVLYYIGKMLNKDKLKQIVSSKKGKILMIKAKDIDKADYWFDTKGGKTVLICRFIPVVRTLISIPAGMSEMSMTKFLIYTTLGSLGWDALLVLLGGALGENWEKVVNIFNKYAYFVVVIMFLISTFGVIMFYDNRKRKKK